MRPLKVKAIVIEEYNDSKNDNKLVEKDTILELDYGRYELLRSKGKVKEYKETKIENKIEEKKNSLL